MSNILFPLLLQRQPLIHLDHHEHAALQRLVLASLEDMKFCVVRKQERMVRWWLLVGISAMKETYVCLRLCQ